MDSKLYSVLVSVTVLASSKEQAKFFVSKTLNSSNVPLVTEVQEAVEKA